MSSEHMEVINVTDQCRIPWASGFREFGPALRVRATNFSATVSTIETQGISGTSGATLKASATNDVTGNVTAGRRSGQTAVSI